MGATLTPNPIDQLAKVGGDLMQHAAVLYLLDERPTKASRPSDLLYRELVKALKAVAPDAVTRALADATEAIEANMVDAADAHYRLTFTLAGIEAARHALGSTEPAKRWKL